MWQLFPVLFCFVWDVKAQNDPVYTVNNLVVNEDGGGVGLQCNTMTLLCTFPSFISRATTGGGATDDPMQTLAAAVVVTPSISTIRRDAIFAVPPAIVMEPTQAVADGTLTFTLNPDMSSDPAIATEQIITVTVTMTDTPNTNNPVVRTFTLTIRSVNDPPMFNTLNFPTVTVTEDSGLSTTNDFLSGVRAGPLTATNELPPHLAAQTLTATCVAMDTTLFQVQPAVVIDPTTYLNAAPLGNAILTFTAFDNAFGTTTVSCTITDSLGGTCVDANCPVVFTIDITPVNDDPIAVIDTTLPIGPSGYPTLDVMSDQSGTPSEFSNFLQNIAPAELTNTWEQPPVQTVINPVLCSAAPMILTNVQIDSVTGMLSLVTLMVANPPETAIVSCNVTDSVGASITIDFAVVIENPSPMYPPVEWNSPDKLQFVLYPPQYPPQFVQRISDGDLTVKLSMPAPVAVNLFPSGVGLLFQPYPIVFNRNEQSKTFKVIGASAGEIRINWTLSDYAVYDPPSAEVIRINENFFIFEPNPLPTIFVGVESPPITVRLAAGIRVNVSLQCTGPSGMVLTPNYLNWTDPTILTQDFTITHDQVYINAPITCAVLGGDRDDFDPPAITVDIRPQFQFIPSTYPELTIGGPPTTMAVKIFKKPNASVILTPTVVSAGGPNCLQFSPPQLDFNATVFVETQFYTVTSSCGGDHLIENRLSGSSSADFMEPVEPNIISVVEKAWGLRFGTGSYFPIVSGMSLAEVFFNTPVPTVIVEVTDSKGVIDRTSTGITIKLSVSDGTLESGTDEAPVVSGVATFRHIKFIDHPTNPMFIFQAVQSGSIAGVTSYPVTGKTIIGGPVAISAVPAYSIRFGSPAESLFSLEGQGANVTVGTIVSKIVVQLLQSDGQIDVQTPNVTISISGDNAALPGTGTREEFVAGNGVFRNFMFTGIPSVNPITLKFTAGSEGGHQVSGSILWSGLVNVLPATCNPTTFVPTCLCTSAPDGSLCSDGNWLSVGDRCQAGSCLGISPTGFTTNPVQIRVGEQFDLSIQGDRLPLPPAFLGEIKLIPPGENCSTYTGAEWPGGVIRARGSATAFTTTAASDVPVVVCFDVDGSGGPMPLVNVGTSGLIIAPATPIEITSITGSTCSSSLSPHSLIGCTEGVITINGRNFDGSLEGNKINFQSSQSLAGSPPTCVVSSVIPGVGSGSLPNQLLCDLKIPASGTGTWTGTVQVLSEIATPNFMLGVVSPRPVVVQLQDPECRTNKIDPLTGCREGTLTILGSGFDDTNIGNNAVLFKRLPSSVGVDSPTCTIITVSPSQLSCSIQLEPLTSGTWEVSVKIFSSSLESITKQGFISFRKTSPVLNEIICDNRIVTNGGGVNACTSGQLTITGYGFDSLVFTDNVIVLGDISCVAVDVSFTVLKCDYTVLPHQAGDYVLQVNVAGEISNGLPISLRGRIPEITSISSAVCQVGSGTISPRKCESGGLLEIVGFGFDFFTNQNKVMLTAGTSSSLQSPNGLPTCDVTTQDARAGTITCALTGPPAIVGVWNLEVVVKGFEYPDRAGASVEIVPKLPFITSIVLDTCESVPGSNDLTNCDDGILTIVGQNFDLRETKNSIKFVSSNPNTIIPSCNVQDSSTTDDLLICPIKFYAGEVGQLSVSVVTPPVESLPSSVRISQKSNLIPMISSIQGGGCSSLVASAALTSFQCTGGPLTITGRYFKPSESNLIFTPTGTNSVATPGCVPPVGVTLSNDVDYECVLSASRGVTGSWYPQIQFGTMQSSNNIVSMTVVPAPVVTGFTSVQCQTAGLGYIHLCEPALVSVGGSLTRVLNIVISGNNFNPDQLTRNVIEFVSNDNTVRCNVTAAIVTQISCLLQLPVLDSSNFFLEGTLEVDGVSSSTSLTASSFSAFTPRVFTIVGGGCQPTATDLYLTECSGGDLEFTGTGFASTVNNSRDEVNVVFKSIAGDSAVTPVCAIKSLAAGKLVCSLQILGGAALSDTFSVKVVIRDKTAPTNVVKYSSGEDVRIATPTVPSANRITGGGCSTTTSVLRGTFCTGGYITISGSALSKVPLMYPNGILLTPTGSSSGDSPTCEFDDPTVNSDSSLTCYLGIPQGSSGQFQFPDIAGPVVITSSDNVVAAISSVEGGGCMPTIGNTGLLSGCKGGQLIFKGDHFSPSLHNSIAVKLAQGTSSTPPTCEHIETTVREIRCGLASQREDAVDEMVEWGVTPDNIPNLNTDAVRVSMIFSPAVFSLSGGGCRTGKPWNLQSCSGGTLTIRGANLDKVTTVKLASGGQLKPTCIVQKVTSNQEIQCGLIIPDGASGKWSVSTVHQSTTTLVESSNNPPVTFEVLMAPVVSFISGGGCQSQLNDCTGGEYLLITGLSFLPNITRVTLTSDSTTTADSPTCNGVAESTTSIRCFLKAPPGITGSWKVLVSSYSLLATTVPVIKIAANPPKITKVFGGGCSSSLTNCSGGVDLVIEGLRFNEVPSKSVLVFRSISGLGQVQPSCEIRERDSTASKLVCKLVTPPGSEGGFALSVRATPEGAMSNEITVNLKPRIVLSSFRNGGCNSDPSSSLSLLNCYGSYSRDTDVSGGNLVIQTSSSFHPGDVSQTAITFSGPVALPTCDVNFVNTSTLFCSLSIPVASLGQSWSVSVTSKGVLSSNIGIISSYVMNPGSTQAKSASGAYCEPSTGTDLESCSNGRLIVKGVHFDFVNPSNNVIQFTTSSPNTAGTSPGCTLVSGSVLPKQLSCDLLVPPNSQGPWTLNVRSSGGSTGSTTGGVSLSMYHPSPVAHEQQYGSRTEPGITVTLTTDIEGLHVRRWRENLAEYLQSRFKFNSGDQTRFPITSKRVLVLSTKAGSSVIDMVFTPIESADSVSQKELTDTFAAAAADVEDGTGIRQFLSIQDVSAAGDVVLPPAYVNPNFVSGSGSSDNWAEDNWWVILIICLFFCCCCCGLAYLCVKHRRNKGESKKQVTDVNSSQKSSAPLPPLVRVTENPINSEFHKQPATGSAKTPAPRGPPSRDSYGKSYSDDYYGSYGSYSSYSYTDSSYTSDGSASATPVRKKKD